MKSILELTTTVKLSPADYHEYARLADEQMQQLTPKRISAVSTYSFQLLEPYLKVEAARRGFHFTIKYGGYGQLESPWLDKESSLVKNNPDIVIIAAEIEHIDAEMRNILNNSTSNDGQQIVSRICERISDLIGSIRRQTAAKILISSLHVPVDLRIGYIYSRNTHSQSALQSLLNQKLLDVIEDFEDVHIFDHERFLVETGTDVCHDNRLKYRARIPFGVSGQTQIAAKIARACRALYTPPKKCLVVDLDNTIWGGVIGEDGLGGIQLGEDFPGNAYKSFQQELLALRNRGILLAIASKNNESEAIEALNNHPDCLLKPEHFSAIEINWNDKAESLARIAETLSIGIDSLAFIDDNPVERNWIREKLPTVSVIEFPESSSMLASLIRNSELFDSLHISEEDLSRAEAYKKQSARKAYEATIKTKEDFLEGLEILVQLEVAKDDSLQRIVQLIGKTNQYNLTTRRHSRKDISDLVQSGALIVSMRVSDRFGDNGLVGVAIAVPQDANIWRIDTFLLSCRVIDRGVELAMFDYMHRMIRAAGGKALRGEYIKTAKNSVCAEFYCNLGFMSLEPSGRHWELAAIEERNWCPSYIKISDRN